MEAVITFYVTGECFQKTLKHHEATTTQFDLEHTITRGELTLVRAYGSYPVDLPHTFPKVLLGCEKTIPKVLQIRPTFRGILSQSGSGR